ncbi:MAG: hypothetical protein KA371_12825 [Acidobacteria bacterium]|nr:hypothetical protein [Acidobacteriota bacterium]
MTKRPSARVQAVVLGLLAAAAYVLVLVVVSEPWDVALGVAVQAAFVAPGLAIVARITPRGERWLPVVAFGPVVGLGASSLTLLALWAAGGRGAWLFLAAPAASGLLAWPAVALRGRWRMIQARPADLRMLLLALLIVPLIVGRPFAMVGAETPEGRVYRKYFTADYVWRRAVVAELAKGDFLPANPYYVNDPLHYYWLPHLLSAVEHRVWPDVDLDALLLTRTVLVDVLFVSALYGFARLAVDVPWAALTGVACGFFATSFEALAAAYAMSRDGMPLATLRYLNIDAISRWIFNGMPIDGLQRVLWYQPHHAAGYLLGFLGVVAIARRTRDRDPAVFAVAGSLLAVSTVISSFAGVMYTAVAAAYELCNVVGRRTWWAGVTNAAWAALPLTIGAALVTAMHYVDQPSGDNLGIVRFGLNAMAAKNFWVVTAMSFGPALLLGAAGLAAAWRRRLVDVVPFLVVLPVVAWFYFYVDVRDHQDVYVGWRVGHIAFMALIPLMGLAFLGASGLQGARRWGAAAALVLTVMLAVPTVLIDIFNTQDIVPNDLGPGWRRTEVLTPPELEGLAWVRTHTDARATVQIDPRARGDEMWAYIPAFAERRMVVGVPLSMVPLRKYEEGSRRVQWLFDAEPQTARAMAERFGIDYLVVGPPERAIHENIEARWATAPDALTLAFKNSALSIYQVQHRRR